VEEATGVIFMDSRVLEKYNLVENILWDAHQSWAGKVNQIPEPL